MSGEAVEKRREGVLFESHSIGKWLCWKTSGMLYIQVDLQITSRVRLVVLYYMYINFTTGCRPYDFC